MISERIAPQPPAPGLFRTPDGVSRLVTFLLVCGLFCLSGLCNEMMEVVQQTGAKR